MNDGDNQKDTHEPLVDSYWDIQKKSSDKQMTNIEQMIDKAVKKAMGVTKQQVQRTTGSSGRTGKNTDPTWCRGRWVTFLESGS